MTKSTRALPLTLLASALAGPASAATVSFDFVGGRTADTTAFDLAPTDSVGAPGYSAANWNALRTDWHGNAGAVPAPLVDSAGSAVGLTIQYDSNNLWSTGDTAPSSGNPNDKMMFGYLDDNSNASGQPYVNVGNLSAWLASQNATGYQVVVYVANDEAATTPSGTKRVGEYWLQNQQADAGAVDLTARIAGKLPSTTFASYEQLVDSVTDDDLGNYIVFDGLTADAFTLRGGRYGGSNTTGRTAIAGFQIVPIPEPATAGLLATGAAGLLLRRRRPAR